MGNCCAKGKHLVHPTDHSSHGHRETSPPPSGAQRIKVRMTAARFKELVSQADLSKGSGEVGHLVLEECLKGKSHARVISGFESKEDQAKVRSLEAIAEEE